MVASVLLSFGRSRLPWPRWPDAALVVAAAQHQAAGELVDDDDLAVRTT